MTDKTLKIAAVGAIAAAGILGAVLLQGGDTVLPDTQDVVLGVQGPEPSEDPGFSPFAWNMNQKHVIGATKQTVVRGSWVNYLDEAGRWKDIDTTIEDRGDRFVMDKAPFAFEAGKRSTDMATFTANVRYDIFEMKEITDAPFTLGIEALGVADVPGELATIAEEGFAADAVRYAGAYPYGDLLYVIQYGTAPRLQKLVQINTPPSGTEDVRIRFRLTSDEARVSTYDKALTAPGKALEAQIRKEHRQEITKGHDADTKLVLRLESRLRDLYARQLRTADRRSDAAISFKAKNAQGRRGAGIKPLYVWDSAGNKELIEYDLEPQDDGSYILTKIVPRSFLDSAVYPVFTDLTTTIYPDPHEEVTTVDGGASHSVPAGASWADLVGALGTSAADSGNVVSTALIRADGNLDEWDFLNRLFVLYDVREIDNFDTLDSAVLSVQGSSKVDNLGILPDLNVFSSNPVSNIALEAGDFDAVGTTAFATAIGFNAWSVSGYNDFTLNASGLAAIDFTGISKFSVYNENYDATNTIPAYTASTASSFVVFLAEEAELTKDPKLVVTHTSTQGPDPIIFIL